MEESRQRELQEQKQNIQTDSTIKGIVKKQNARIGDKHTT